MLAIGKPVCGIIDRQVGSLFPIIGARVHECDCPLKTASTGQFIRLGTQMPFAGHIGVIAGTLQQRCNRYNVIPQHALIVLNQFLLGG